MTQQTPTKIQEGKTKVFVYLQKDTKTGPAAKIGIPFYNQTMEINRDSSLLIGQWLLNTSEKHVQSLKNRCNT